MVYSLSTKRRKSGEEGNGFCFFRDLWWEGGWGGEGLVERRGALEETRKGGGGVVNANRKTPPYVGVLNIICIV